MYEPDPDGSFSKCGFRISAAHVRLKHLQEFYGLRACRFQNVALSLAPRTFVYNKCESFTDRGRFLFSKCGFRLSTAHIPFQNLQEFDGLKAVLLKM
eukprot:3764546-Pyramimonas_sp.AAC.1